jgi:Exostosin family
MPRLPFDTLQRLDLPLTEVVGGRIGFVHDLFLSFPFEVCDRLPAGGDLVVLTGKTERSEAIEELGAHPGRVVLVMAPGDAPVRKAYLRERRALPLNFVALFATSNELLDFRTVSVPLGVRVNKLMPLQFVRQNWSGERERLLYGNFTVNDAHYRPRRDGTPHVRHRLVERLRDEKWVDLDISAEQRDSPEELIRYYSRIAAHRFVLSPEGNGIDCYRTWEALYLGAIPVVMTSASTSAFAELPILFTDDYGELSEEYLEQRWKEMSRRSFEIERMLASWYSHRFLAAVGRLASPRFLCWKFDSPKFHDVLRRSSRSAAGIVAECPLPPFVASDGLMTRDGWNAPGRLRLEEVAGGLRLVAEGEGRAVVEIPLHTIPGGRFRLTGRIHPEGQTTQPLTIDVEQRPDVIAAVQVRDGANRDLTLEFVARSNRTVLSIRAAESGSAAWLIEDMELHAEL